MALPVRFLPPVSHRYLLVSTPLQCYGKFLTSIVEHNEAKVAFEAAYDCYTAWGAFAKAEKLKREYLAPLPDEARSSSSDSMKRELTGEGEVSLP